jgi:ArsR family transcriptional regulator, arsenate/arsenite/antimonite-responsive transcriptional repressor
MQRVFEAFSSTVLSAGEIAARFDTSKPSVSQHLSVLEAAGLVISDERGQFVNHPPGRRQSRQHAERVRA